MLNELISHQRTPTSNNAFAFSTFITDSQGTREFYVSEDLHRRIPFRRSKSELVSISISIHRDRYGSDTWSHISEIESWNRIANICTIRIKKEKTTAEVQPPDKIENCWRYLRDRECGERWDRSTSHKNQKQKQNQNRHCHTKHTVEVQASLYSVEISENSATRRAILTQVTRWAILVGGTSCRRSRSPPPLKLFLRQSSVSKDFHE